MKRTGQLTGYGKKTGDFNKDLTPAQYEHIGRIAIAYNEVEISMQVIFSGCFGVSAALTDEFNSRIGSIEAITTLAKKAIGEFVALKEHHNDFFETIDTFTDLKQYRDAVIHARMFHAPTAIGKTNAHKGRRREILLSETALKALYERFVAFRDEIIWLNMVTICLYMIQSAYRHFPTRLDQRREQIEPMLQFSLLQYQDYRGRRRSLKPLPTFPEISEGQQGPDIAKVFEELLDKLAVDLGVAHYRNPLREQQKPGLRNGGK